MTDDAAFRIAMALMLVGAALIGVPHRLRANSGESLDRRQEGLFILVTLRATAAALFAFLVAYLIHPPLVKFAAVPLPAGVRWAGFVVGLLSLGLMWWTLTTLGRNLTDTVVTRREHTLVTSGPYRLARHPYYVTTLLLVVAAFLLTANLLIGIPGLAVFVLLAIRSRTEERKLVERFGDAYRDYARRTGRFLPRPPFAQP